MVLSSGILGWDGAGVVFSQWKSTQSRIVQSPLPPPLSGFRSQAVGARLVGRLLRGPEGRSSPPPLQRILARPSLPVRRVRTPGGIMGTPGGRPPVEAWRTGRLG